MTPYILILVLCSNTATNVEQCTGYEIPIEHNLSQNDCELYSSTDNGLEYLSPTIDLIKQENYDTPEVIQIRYLTCEPLEG